LRLEYIFMKQTILEQELLDCYRRLSPENKREALTVVGNAAAGGTPSKAGKADRGGKERAGSEPGTERSFV
jgi:hypothetical protein